MSCMFFTLNWGLYDRPNFLWVGVAWLQFVWYKNLFLLLFTLHAMYTNEFNDRPSFLWIVVLKYNMYENVNLKCKLNSSYVYIIRIKFVELSRLLSSYITFNWCRDFLWHCIKLDLKIDISNSMKDSDFACGQKTGTVQIELKGAKDFLKMFS